MSGLGFTRGEFHSEYCESGLNWWLGPQLVESFCDRSNFLIENRRFQINSAVRQFGLKNTEARFEIDIANKAFFWFCFAEHLCSVHAWLSILEEGSLLCCSFCGFFPFCPLKGLLWEYLLITIKGLRTENAVQTVKPCSANL